LMGGLLHLVQRGGTWAGCGCYMMVRCSAVLMWRLKGWHLWFS